MLPTCAGWNGTIGYPARNGLHERLHWRVTSSISENFGVPPPPSGTAILYVRMEGGASTFQDSNDTDTVTSPSLNARHSYSLLVYNFAWDNQCGSGSPPWAANLGSPSPDAYRVAQSR